DRGGSLHLGSRLGRHDARRCSLLPAQEYEGLSRLSLLLDNVRTRRRPYTSRTMLTLSVALFAPTVLAQARPPGAAVGAGQRAAGELAAGEGTALRADAEATESQEAEGEQAA